MPGREREIIENQKALARKATYVRRKRTVMDREKTNDRLVILFHSDGKWWKIAGKSVVYYTKLIAPRIKKRPNILPDDDYSDKSEQGVIMVGDVEKFLEKVKALGLKEVKESNEEYRAIELNQKVTPEEYNALVREDEEKWEMIGRMLMPAVAWPAIKSTLLATLSLTRETTRHFSAPLQRTIGDGMMLDVIDMIKNLNMTAHRQKDPLEGLIFMEERLDSLDAYLMCVTQLRLFQSNKAYDYATLTQRLRKLVEKEINKGSKRQK